MNREVSQEQINIEAESGYRPLAIDSGITALPLSDLSDREFELLAYLLIQQEIGDSKHENVTRISLMQGVSERGRDCVLYNDGVVSGLVQCKKYKGRLTRPQAIKEILKFILFSTLDDSILPDPDNFEYKLYVSNDFTEPAISLINSYAQEITHEITDGNISNYIIELVHEYESFSSYIETPPHEAVTDILKKLKVSSCNATNLCSRIYSYNSILSLFFNVKSVVDLESADNLFRKALDDYGLKIITDDDLKLLQERIGNTKKENRLNFGYSDFYGYSVEFIKYLKDDHFKEVMTSIMKVKSSLDMHKLDFIQSKIHELVLKKITINLLHAGKIHPFSVGVAAPYLFKRLTMKVVANNMPEKMLHDVYPQFTKSKNELISEIAEILYDASERVMKGDYSHFVGNPDDIELKLRLFNHMHNGLNNIGDAKSVFENDITVINPVLDEIENEIGKFLPEEQTIVIKDGAFFDRSEELNKMVKTINAIEK